MRLIGTVKDRRRHRHPGLQVLSQFDELIAVQMSDLFLEVLFAVNVFELRFDCLDVAAAVNVFLDQPFNLFAEAARRPAEVGLQNLPDVHARGHTQRIQNQVNRRSVFEIRHVFLRHDQ